MSRLNKILLVILIILAILTAIIWFFPDAFAQLTAFNPFRRKDIPETSVNLPPSTQQGQQTPKTINNTNSLTMDEDGNEKDEETIEVLTPFEKEIEQRHKSYQTKVFTYEPYELAVNRNPFKFTSIAVEDKKMEEEKIQYSKELISDPKSFVMQELKLSGIVSLYDEFVAILKIQEEYFVVKKNELILGTYFVTKISENNIIIVFENNEIVLKLKEG